MEGKTVKIRKIVTIATKAAFAVGDVQRPPSAAWQTVRGSFVERLSRLFVRLTALHRGRWWQPILLLPNMGPHRGQEVETGAAEIVRWTIADTMTRIA